MTSDAQLLPGAVWWVDSYRLSGPDKKQGRPVVIVQGPRAGIMLVVVWARTTDVTITGVLTPAGVLDELNRAGVFAPRHQHSIRIEHMREPSCRYLGMLPEPHLSHVSQMWESL